MFSIKYSNHFAQVQAIPFEIKAIYNTDHSDEPNILFVFTRTPFFSLPLSLVQLTKILWVRD